MNVLYAFVAIFFMLAVYFGLSRTRSGERDLTAIFQGAMFQLTRRLQITLQKNRVEKSEGGWRPSIIAVTRFGDRRLGAFRPAALDQPPPRIRAFHPVLSGRLHVRRGDPGADPCGQSY